MDTACSVDTWEGDEDSVFIGNRGSTHLRDYASKDGHGYNLVVLGAWHYLTGELLRRGRDKDHMLFVLKTIGQIHPPCRTVYWRPDPLFYGIKKRNADMDFGITLAGGLVKIANENAANSNAAIDMAWYSLGCELIECREKLDTLMNSFNSQVARFARS